MSIRSVDLRAAALPVLSRDFELDFIERTEARIARLHVPDSVELWRSRCADVRDRMLALFSTGHPEGLFDELPEVRWGETIDAGHGYSIRKLAYEGYPGMWVPALLYLPEPLTAGAPAVLNTNGHHSGGKAMDYKQARCINLAKRGIIALNTELIGMGQLSASLPHNRLAYLDACGVRGVGLFYSVLKRGLDLLLELPEVDAARVAVTGLSGGGWQAAVLSALDTRVTVSAPVAGHSPVWQRIHNPSDIGDLEQIPPDLCTVADYDMLTAMIAPRPLLLIYNRYDDCCFQSERTRASVYETARKAYELLDAADNIEFYENLDPGTHNYDADSRSRLYRFLDARFGLDTEPVDLPWRSELMTEGELAVELPQSNASLLSVALDVSRTRRKDRTEELDTARRRVIECIRMPECSVRGYHAVQRAAQKGAFVERGVLRLDCSFDLPVAVIDSDEAPGVGNAEVGLVVCDEGRRGAEWAGGGWAAWRTALFADLFGTGEASLPPRYDIVFSGTGGRSLGLQVSQLIAVLRWMKREYKRDAIPVIAAGRGVSVAALIACVVEPGCIRELTTERLPSSFHDLIEQTEPYDSFPSLFCFGLFDAVDIPDLLRLAGIPVRDAARGPLTREALGTKP